MAENDQINILDDGVNKPQSQKDKVIGAEASELAANLSAEQYTEYLQYASEEIKNMFNAFSPEDKKKYAEVVKHTPTQTEFHFSVTRNNGTLQNAIYKVNKQRVTIPEKELKAGFVEKYNESGYEGDEYFANAIIRKTYTPEGQGLTTARFKALVKAMPAGDFTGTGTDKPSVAIRQLFISLGGKRSEYRPVDKNGIVGEKIPANDEHGHGYNETDDKEITARKGYLALDDVDNPGKPIIISAMKDPSDYHKGTAFEADENQMYPRISFAEKPTITYTKDGKAVDKDGNIL